VVNVPDDEKDRVIEAAWAEDAVQKKDDGFLVLINIYARDRAGLLNDLTRIFSEKDISILRISSVTNKQGIATLTLGFEVKSTQDLHDITTRIQGVRDVQAVRRTSG
jgi:GTP pyrophosphokinase